MDQLTRADIAKMPPHEVELARQSGQLDELLAGGQGGTKDAEKKQIDRRVQKARPDMIGLDEKEFEAELKAGHFDSVLEGATHVLDIATGDIYEITSTAGEDDLSPVVKAKDAAGEDREDLAEKLFTDWVPLTNDIYLVARETMDSGDNWTATKKPLPLKPAYADAIKSGEMIVVDPDTSKSLLAFKTDKDLKDHEKEQAAIHKENGKIRWNELNRVKEAQSGSSSQFGG